MNRWHCCCPAGSGAGDGDVWEAVFWIGPRLSGAQTVSVPRRRYRSASVTNDVSTTAVCFALSSDRISRAPGRRVAEKLASRASAGWPGTRETL